MKSVKLDITIQKGSTFRRVFQLKQADGTPVNLTNFMMRGHLRKTIGSQHFLNLNPTIIDPVNGKWKMELTAPQTSGITFSFGFYDIELYDPSTPDEVNQIMWGSVVVREEVTR